MVPPDQGVLSPALEGTVLILRRRSQFSPVIHILELVGWGWSLGTLVCPPPTPSWAKVHSPGLSKNSSLINMTAEHKNTLLSGSASCRAGVAHQTTPVGSSRLQLTSCLVAHRAYLKCFKHSSSSSCLLNSSAGMVIWLLPSIIRYSKSWISTVTKTKNNKMLPTWFSSWANTRCAVQFPHWTLPPNIYNCHTHTHTKVTLTHTHTHTPNKVTRTQNSSHCAHLFLHWLTDTFLTAAGGFLQTTIF